MLASIALLRIVGRKTNTLSALNNSNKTVTVQNMVLQSLIYNFNGDKLYDDNRY